MTHATFCSLVLIGTMTAIAAPAYAQQTPDATKAPATAPDTTAPATTAATAATSGPTTPAAKKPSAAAETPDVPSADTLKKAREAGYHTKVRRGEVYYCKDVVETGTRFKTESCLDENQLTQALIHQQAQRDQLSNRNCSGGGCSGK
jgi:hypothetical protein